MLDNIVIPAYMAGRQATSLAMRLGSLNSPMLEAQLWLRRYSLSGHGLRICGAFEPGRSPSKGRPPEIREKEVSRPFQVLASTAASVPALCAAQLRPLRERSAYFF